MTSKAYRANYQEIDWSGLKTESVHKADKQTRGLYFIPDITPYRSPIDGSVIGGRRQHRDHMRAHGVEEMGNEKPKPPRRRELPPVQHDIKAAIEQVQSGYRPEPLHTYREE